ncbi:MAG: DEAD/DEAH box helicase, partial [Terracidiphilus sp.]
MSRLPPKPDETTDPFACFHPVTAAWFKAVFDAPTAPQRMGWPVIARGENALILAPTGTGKTLAAFLWCLDRLMLDGREPGTKGTREREKGGTQRNSSQRILYQGTASAVPKAPPNQAGALAPEAIPAKPQSQGCRIVYVSPLKALAVDVERNLRSPLAGMANMARRMGVAFHEPQISVRTGDTPQRERARFARHPADILITTPESLYLMLTSRAAEALRTVETVIIDEIHALVPTKRGAHLALTLERLQALTAKPLQRIGLSATQRPLEEVARFLGGVDVARAEKREPAGQRVSKPAGSRKATADPSTPSAVAPFAQDDNSGVGEISDSLRPGVLAPSLPDVADAEPLRYRPVTIVNAAGRKQLKLRIEVPVEDMARLGEMEEIPSGPASQTPRRVSIWNAIHPRLLEIIRERNSTILFVNARQTAERLAGALNDLAGEPIARAHHGSLAAAQRSVIEEQLKAGQIRALCATSTLELGIDMGAVDLVVQIESPPSVASGMQRIGRAGHHVDAVSEGILFPKFRADLVACAAVTRAMHDGHIESTRFPRNPLDVLCQQLVAIVSSAGNKGTREQGNKKAGSKEAGFWDQGSEAGAESALLVSGPLVPQSLSPEVSVDFLFDLVRGAAPFGSLSRSAFEGVLDLLSGRYPSDEFAELRPRLTWDRVRNVVSAREGAARLAILNAGTIPDRGLYGVFLAFTEGKSVRVGELDEEMVFESHPNETFILGASTWRITDITHDRVLVTPAPGEPGKMPFWKGDGPGRPLEFGRRIGAMVRELRALPEPTALTRLVGEHDLDPAAAENLLRFLADQAE